MCHECMNRAPDGCFIDVQGGYIYFFSNAVDVA